MDATQHTIGTEMDKLFNMCHKYVIAHCHLPGNPFDNPSTTAAVQTTLISAAGTLAEANTLLSDPQHRPLLFTKVIALWIEQTIFKCTTFEGCPDAGAIDAKIRSIMDEMYDSTPASIKAPRYQNVAAAVQDLQRNPSFPTFLQHLVKERAEALWPFLTFLHGRKTTADWADFHQLVHEAHQLALRLFAGPYQFLFRYFRGDPFSQSEMVVRGGDWQNVAPATLEARGFTVAFALSPRVEARRYFANGNITTTTITKAAVLLQPPTATAAAPPPAAASSPALPSAQF